jgi:hypothetical protein
MASTCDAIGVPQLPQNFRNTGKPLSPTSLNVRPAFDPKGALWHGDDERERRACLLLAVPAVADCGQKRFSVTAVSDCAAETPAVHSSHGMLFPPAVQAQECCANGPMLGQRWT